MIYATFHNWFKQHFMSQLIQRIFIKEMFNILFLMQIKHFS